jgi:hypothetical protein
MSDHELHDDAPHQDWQGGPQTSQEPQGAERDAAYESIYLGLPPLQGASLERLQLCRDALAIVLLESGIKLSDVSRLAAACVRRLQEPLDQ